MDSNETGLKNVSIADWYIEPSGDMGLEASVLLGLGYSLVCVVAVIVNLLIVVVYVFDAHVRNTKHSCFLVNIAVCDFILGALVLPLTALHLALDDLLWDPAVCTIYLVLSFWIVTESNLTMILIGWDRYLRSVYAMMYDASVTKKSVVAKIGASWVIAAAYYSFLIVLWPEVDEALPENVCFWGFRKNLMVSFIWPLVQYILTTLVTAVLFWKTYRNLRHRNLVMADGHFSDNTDQTLDKEARDTTYWCICLFAYIISFSTIVITFLVDSQCYCITRTTYLTVGLVLGLTTITNPLLYTFRTQERLRLQAKRVLCFWKWSQITPMLQVTDAASPFDQHLTAGGLNASSSTQRRSSAMDAARKHLPNISGSVQVISARGQAMLTGAFNDCKYPEEAI